MCQLERKTHQNPVWFNLASLFLSVQHTPGQINITTKNYFQQKLFFKRWQKEPFRVNSCAHTFSSSQSVKNIIKKEKKKKLTQ